jgi:hypothetical protein
MTTRLFAARTCASMWRLVEAIPALKLLEKNASGLWNRSRLLNHPFVQLQRGFVFIHVPKAAGTSLRDALGLKASLDIPGHASARDVLPFIKLVAPEIKAIAFVRNPYSRFFSLYNYARQKESLYHSVSRPAQAPYGKNIDYDILQDKSLEQCAELLVEGKLGGNGPGLKMWQPQVEWLIDREGSLAVDFIGRVETLHADLAKLQKRFGITTGPVPWLNKSDPAKSIRLSSRAQDLVRSYYKRDFEMLGYDENYNSESATPIEAAFAWANAPTTSTRPDPTAIKEWSTGEPIR